MGKVRWRKTIVVFSAKALIVLPPHSLLQEHGESSSRGSSSEDSEENSEEASDLSDSELDADSYYFLQVSHCHCLCFETQVPCLHGPAFVI